MYYSDNDKTLELNCIKCISKYTEYECKEGYYVYQSIYNMCTHMNEY